MKSSAYDVKRVIWLTHWLDTFYESWELEDFASYCSGNLKQTKPANRFLIVQALSESKKLNRKFRDELVKETEKDLSSTLPEIKEWKINYDIQRNHEIDSWGEEISFALDNKDYTTALAKLAQLKNLDEAKSTFWMGFIYDAMENYDKAEQYYLMAVEHGDELAMFNLGFLYENTKKDYNKAEKYYLMAVEKGVEEAMSQLGLLYQDIKKDYDKAEQYYLMAVEKGDEYTMYSLGYFYQDIKKDYDKAEQYFLMAVDKGGEYAMINLGDLYDYIKKDYDKAEQYYLMAVENGDERAMFNLGFLYYDVRKDYNKAEKYYRMAVENGDERAMVNLGLLCQDIKRDYSKAEEYYLMAVEKGDDMAMVSLGWLYNDIKKDYDKAEKYFLMAVKKGDDMAMVSLGLLYDYIKKDYSKSEKYYLMAVGKGNDMAKNNLAFLYYEKNDIDKKLTALSITEDLDKSDPIFFATRVQLLLWNEKIKEASNVLNEFIKKYLQVAEAFQSISDALISFLVFKQKQFLYQLFTAKEYESLTDKFKPIYFALLQEMKTELPDEYLKMTEEISEPVNDLLKLVKEERKRLGIE